MRRTLLLERVIARSDDDAPHSALRNSRWHEMRPWTKRRSSQWDITRLQRLVQMAVANVE
jgi:hypothetical protein